MKFTFDKIYIFSAGIALINFLIYAFTAARTVQEIDSGELATVQLLLGIAHPTGYPLFTLLGYIWGIINPGLSPIYWQHIFSAFFAALANGLFFIFFCRIIVFINNNNKTQTSKIKILLSATAAVFMLAFSTTYWLQATQLEVHSLQAMLLSFTLVIFMVAIRKNSKRWFIVSGSALGLLFANHLTAVLILPFVALVYFRQYKLKTNGLQTFGLSIISCVVTAIILYAYLPIRSATEPLLDWGNPESWAAFYRHVSGWQFIDWFNGKNSVWQKNMQNFFYSIPQVFSYIGIGLLAIGTLKLIKNSFNWFLIIITTIVFGIFYVAHYAIFDLAPYFLLPNVFLVLIMSFGFLWVLIYLKDLKQRVLIRIGIFAVPLFLMLYNLNVIIKKNGTHIQQFATDALTSVDRDAIIFSRLWDVFVAPSIYLQAIEGYRKDVFVLDKELFRRSWYPEQIKRWPAGAALKTSTKAEETFLKALKPFEAGKSYNPQVIQNRFENYLSNIITENLAKHPVYLSPEIVKKEVKNGRDIILPNDVQLVPMKYFYKIVPSKQYIPIDDTTAYKFALPKDTTRFTKMIRQHVFVLIEDRLRYDMYYKKWQSAMRTYKHLQAIFPNAPMPKMLRKKMLSITNK